MRGSFTDEVVVEHSADDALRALVSHFAPALTRQGFRLEEQGPRELRFSRKTKARGALVGSVAVGFLSPSLFDLIVGGTVTQALWKNTDWINLTLIEREPTKTVVVLSGMGPVEAQGGLVAGITRATNAASAAAVCSRCAAAIDGGVWCSDCEALMLTRSTPVGSNPEIDDVLLHLKKFVEGTSGDFDEIYQSNVVMNDVAGGKRMDREAVRASWEHVFRKTKARELEILAVYADPPLWWFDMRQRMRVKFTSNWPAASARVAVRLEDGKIVEGWQYALPASRGSEPNVGVDVAPTSPSQALRARAPSD